MLTQFLRYEPVARHLESSGGRTLLEVGGGSRGVGPYLGDAWEITNCDLAFDDYGAEHVAKETRATRVVASVLELPFEDDSFDAVVALDLLEHIEPASRRRALCELARVARTVAVIGCPTGEQALQADETLAHLYAARGWVAPGWLTEHFENGFPQVSLLRETLTPFGEVAIVPNTNVRARVALARLEVSRIGGWSGVLFRRLAPAVKRSDWRRTRARVLAKVLRGFDAPPAYRTIAVLNKGLTEVTGGDRANGAWPPGQRLE
jgi:ubiquinone/menaquinone biosynthesis C-methylase UbiE